MKRLFVLAPNDRFNYGDLLFPHIITACFKDCFDEINYCSTTESDLSDKGGVPTESFRILYDAKLCDDNYLIVAGGECLCVEWGVIISFISERYEKIFKYIDRKTRKWPPQRRWLLRNFIARKILRAKTLFPFTIGKNELPNFKGVFYNSLGGGGLANEMFILRRNDVRKILDSVDYISVRDVATHQIISTINTPPHLAADSAVLMSDIFTEDMLLENVAPLLLPFGSKRYIFFQCNESIARRDISCIVEELRKIQSHFGCDICLCPIGTAVGHCDDKGLSEIYDNLQTAGLCTHFHLIENPGIYDIMWLIKHSQLYIGSSLHGIITAMSFGAPYCGYCVEKVSRYIESWGDRRCFSPRADTLADCCYYAGCQTDAQSLEKQKKSVRDSFDKIKSFIR